MILFCIVYFSIKEFLVFEIYFCVICRWKCFELLWGISPLKRQISLVGVVLQTYSQIRALYKVFPRGCCFCTYPAWDAPVLLATSCMVDTCRRVEGRASTAGDFVHGGHVSKAGRTRQHCWRFQPRDAPLLLALCACCEVPSTSAAAEARCSRRNTTPIGDLRLLKSLMPLAFWVVLRL